MPYPTDYTMFRSMLQRFPTESDIPMLEILAEQQAPIVRGWSNYPVRNIILV